MDSTLETVGSINMILSLLAALGIVMTAYGGIKISVRRRRMLTYLGMVLLGGLVFIFAISWFRYMRSFASLLIKYEIWR